MDRDFKWVYKRVFYFCLILVFAALGCAVLFGEPMTEAQKDVLRVVTHGISLCIGFLVGGFASSLRSRKMRNIDTPARS